MQQIDYLYKKEGSNEKSIKSVERFPVFKQIPFSRKCPFGHLSGEKFNFKTFLARFWFKLITGGNLTIYYTTDSEGRVTHTSYLIGKCFKFPFMSSSDFEIGPCYTRADYRGRGIYPSVLSYITQAQGINGNFYMLVNPCNASSIRGIEKAGFIRIGKTKKTRLKRYIKIV